MNRVAGDRCRELTRRAERCWADTAMNLAVHRGIAPDEAARVARRVTLGAFFLRLCRQHALTESEASVPELWPVGEGPQRDCGDLLEQALDLLADVPGPDPIEFLGTIHQRLLDLRLDRDEHGAWRRSARRSGRRSTGTFYTPGWLAEYLARQVLDGEAAAELPVLDPACGSGAFLIVAWHVLAARRTSEVGPAGVLERLHGVDVDAEAVLLTRRSLWLAARLAAAMPDPRLAQILGQNIRCGDLLLDPPEPTWPERFGVILGNPPYRRELGAKPLLDRLAATRLGRQYRSPRMDLSYYFLHRSLELLEPGGHLAFVLGAYWTAGRGAARVIEALRTQTQVEEIVCLDRARVFAGVSGRHLLLTLRKGQGGGPTRIKRLTTSPETVAGESFSCRVLQSLGCFAKSADQLFRDGNLDLEPAEDGRLAQIERWPALGGLAQVRQGIVENPASVTRAAAERFGLRAGEGVFALSSAEVAALNLPEAERALLRPYHDLCDLGRHTLASTPSLWLIYSTPETWSRFEQFPCLGAHLERFRPIMEARRETCLGRRPWWHLHWPRDESLWRAAKLVSLQMGRRPAFVAAEGPLYVPFSANVVVPRPETRESLLYLAGVLNSGLLWTWFRHRAKQRGVGLEINGHVLAKAPIRRIDLARPEECRAHDEVVRLVRRRMACPRGGTSPGDDDASDIEQELDRLVCRLYGVSEETAEGTFDAPVA